MKHPNMSDTLIACCGSIGYMLPYMRGEYAPHYPVPTTIGFVPSGYGTYLIDTRKRMDGMPLFRGYTWEQWVTL